VAGVGCALRETVQRHAFLAHVREAGEYLAARLRGLSSRLGHGEGRGRGLLLALALTRGGGGKGVDGAFDRGLLINAPRPDTLRFMPALTVTREEIHRMLEL